MASQAPTGLLTLELLRLILDFSKSAFSELSGIETLRSISMFIITKTLV